MRSFESLGSTLGQVLFRIAAAEADHLDGRPAQALGVLRDLIERRRNGGGYHYLDAELHRLYGEFLLAGEPDAATEAEAREHLQRAVEVARSEGARTLERRAEASLAAAGTGAGTAGGTPPAHEADC